MGTTNSHVGGTLHNITRQACLCILSLLPVFVSSGSALYVLWRLPPTGITPRFFVIAGLNFGYIVSAAITASMRWSKISQNTHFLVIWIKDCCVAATSLSLSIMSTVVFFNSCDSWAPLGNRFVVLDQRGFERNWKHIYLIVFWLELAVQAGIFLFLYLFLYRKGFAVLRWPRATKDKAL
jgi:hypothetical protein